MYVRNAWYVACTPDEIAAAPLGRTICGERMVLFRGEGGAVSALEDFCPHRGAPLSLGRVREDGRIVCGYHGLVMGGDGRCVEHAGSARAADDQVVSRRSSATASSGSGRARRRRRSGASCTRCPGPRAPSGPTAAASITSLATTG